jgi:hypothetical protein
MKKLMLATFSLVCVFAIAGGTATAPAAAAPATAAAAAPAPQIGGCRWVCAGLSTRFTSQAACETACGTECEVLC